MLAATMGADAEPIDIFISYSRFDQLFVDQLLSYLRGCGFRPWMDVHRLDPGVEWRMHLQEALDRAPVLVLVVSNNALRSRNVRMEYLYALRQGKLVILTLIEDCTLPKDLGECPSVRVNRWYVDEEHMAQLVQLLPLPHYDPVFTDARNARDNVELPYVPRRSVWLFKLYSSTVDGSWQRFRIGYLGLSLLRWIVLVSEFFVRLTLLIIGFIFVGDAILQTLRELFPVFAVPPLSMVLVLGYILLGSAFGGIAGVALWPGFTPYNNVDDRSVAWRHLFYALIGGPAVGYLIAQIAVVGLPLVLANTPESVFHDAMTYPPMLGAMGGLAGGLVGFARCYRLIPAYWRWIRQRDREGSDDL